MNRLKKYGFKDENGHPLENCADYQDILTALEQAEARADKAEKELAGADAEIAELQDELEDSRGTEKDAPNILCAIARLVGVYEHCQEIGDDMGTMSLDAVQGLLAEKQKSEAESARLTKALEIQRNLTASAHATAQAAWGGEIPSPFPGHKPPSEDAMVERFNHLNCPLCGGSGHIDDCDKTSAEAIARLTKMVDWLAGRELTVDGFAAPCQCESGYFQGKKAPCGERPDEFCPKFNNRGNGACWVEAARRAVAAGEVNNDRN